MISMHDQHDRWVVGGVDTHGEIHVAAAVDEAGRILGTESFPATLAGYGALHAWLRRHGQLLRIGVEGTGSYGKGLCRHLSAEGVEVVEVNRPDRQRRRRRGKSDPVDAESAARAALNGEASATPKSGDGLVESLRALVVARRSAVKARTQAANQLRDLIVTAPDQLRCRLRDLNTDQRIEICARFRPGQVTETIEAAKFAMRSLAQRHLQLDAEIGTLDTHIAELCAAINPGLLGACGVGVHVAAALLIAAGANPDRMHSEAAFAALCGASPVEASSGKVDRHRLNRGGDRQANCALWTIALVRMSSDAATRAYVARRTREGKTKKDIVRCLKRHIARQMYHLITQPVAVPAGADLRQARLDADISLATAAKALGTWPTRISELERGLDHNTDLAHRYHAWLHPDQVAP
jgi:transposase